ncbi:lytic transglycosylase [Salmonella enterica subsp. enterica]|nr:lytic transglycosylase [Salmonella enterica subsp. enterica serovar Limete]
MAIKIPVSAQFDAADLQQQIKMVNDQIRILASQVGQANKQKWEPINLKSKDDLQGFIKQMDLLMKKQTEFAQRMKQSGQTGNPLFANFKKMSGGSLGEQIKLMESVLGWAGVEFSNLPAPKPPKQPNHPVVVPPRQPEPPVPAWRREMQRQGMNGLHSILGNAGPVGGTISNALSTGMASGAGAGMAGLVGGLAALGVGKIIGAIADKIGQAQDNAIGLDKLYRQVGGMVAYSRLGTGVGDIANRLGMNNADAIGMASTYARSANLRPGDNLGTGLLVSGGLARQFGLDMNGTAATIGSMRGNNTIGNDQQLRRMGGVMGEAIGKSGAFARADDVMSSIAEFASAQAQESGNAPDLARYAGALSSLAGQNLPGMDVRTSAALIGRANGALMNGTAAGPAGQMLMASLGNRYGLSPAQLRVWQENGMFGTLSSSVGAGSLYANTTGHSGPEGDTTLFGGVSGALSRRYKPGSDEYYQAMSRTFGISYSQAMTLSRMDTNGTLNGAANLMRRNGINADKMDASTFGVMGQIASGKGLEAMGNQYLNRSGLQAGERQRLTDALKGTDPEKLKDVLAEVASKHGGTTTEGSQIRDNVAKLNNTFEEYSKRALPALDMMRMALVKMAGNGSDEASLRQSYASNEKAVRQRRIDKRFDNANRELQMQLNLVTGNDAEANAKRKVIIDKQHANDKQRQIEISAMNAEVDKIAGSGSTAGEGQLSSGYLTSPAAAAAAGDGATGPATGNWSGNNVGNVKDVNGNFLRFGSQAEGIAASASRFLRYNTGAFRNGRAGRKTTLRQMIATYAPSSENKTDDYVAFVAKRTGIKPDAQIDARDPNILRAVTSSALIMENKKNRDLDPRIIDQGVNAALADRNNYTADRAPLDINTNHQVDVVLHHPDGNRQRVTTKFRQAHQWGGR